MRMATVYIETSIIGYLTTRLSRDLIVAAHQQITRDWWDLRRTSYELYVSEAVVAECESGDAEAAKERLQQVAGLPVLDISQDAEHLAEQLLLGVPLPAKAQVDALHMALAAVNGVGLSAHLELQAYSKCHAPTQDRSRLQGDRV